MIRHGSISNLWRIFGRVWEAKWAHPVAPLFVLRHFQNRFAVWPKYVDDFLKSFLGISITPIFDETTDDFVPPSKSGSVRVTVFVFVSTLSE